MAKSPEITLWTTQPLDAWETLKTQGYLYGKKAFVDEDFVAPYEWMIAQMLQRIGPPPEAGIFPIWAWYQYDDISHRRPDLRQSGYLPRGTKGVRIEFEIDPQAVLLSDFNLWHCVLNATYLPDSISEMEEFDRELDDLELNFSRDVLQHPVYGPRIEASWQRIFDLDWADEEITHPIHKKCIQTVLWQLNMDMVRRVDTFVAR